MTRVACIGECMIELRQVPGGQSGGLYSRGYGGDTLNTAVYLSRLGVDVRVVARTGPRVTLAVTGSLIFLGVMSYGLIRLVGMP